MSWRFRKVFSGGPFRWNLSRRGIGWSCGIPGLRYGVSANGRRYVSFGIPGFGLYWIKYLDEGPAEAATADLDPASKGVAGQVWRRLPSQRSTPR